jgi:sulfur relay (sulfurtransferase) complex TusBCD TusD component (DsrE family)
MTQAVPRSDVLLKVLGAPHRTELVTSLFRLTEALLERDATVQIWACGDATGLTRASLGMAKPADVTDRARTFPSTAALARDLITANDGRLRWYVCRFCARDRGHAQQIDEVKTRPAARFWEHVTAADQMIVMGVC